MKKRDERKEVHEASDAEIAVKLEAAREEWFRARFQRHTNQLDNVMRIQSLRRRIARLRTEASARRRAAAHGGAR